LPEARNSAVAKNDGSGGNASGSTRARIHLGERALEPRLEQPEGAADGDDAG
jgi:hypothetical protein